MPDHERRFWSLLSGFYELKSWKNLEELSFIDIYAFLFAGHVKTLFKEILRLPKFRVLKLTMHNNKPGIEGYELFLNDIAQYLKYDHLVISPFVIDNVSEYEGLTKQLGWIHDLNGNSFRKRHKKVDEEYNTGKFKEVIEAMRKLQDYKI